MNSFQIQRAKHPDTQHPLAAKPTAHKLWLYLGLFCSAALFLACYAKFRTCLKEFGDITETSAYLFYREPSAAEGLAKECQSQGLICETWLVGEAQGLQAEGLSHIASGYAVWVEGGRLGELLGARALPNADGSHSEHATQQMHRNTLEPPCILSTQLAHALFGSGRVTGKKVLYQGTLYAIQHTIPSEMPILFLEKSTATQNAGLQGTMSSPAISAEPLDTKRTPDIPAESLDTKRTPDIPAEPLDTKRTPDIPAESQGIKPFLAISLVQEADSLSYQNVGHLFAGSDIRLDMPLLKWVAILAASLCSFGCLMLLFAPKNCFPAGTSIPCKSGLPKSSLRRCMYAICMLLWIGYVKLELCSFGGTFPIWALPGTWSDFEGWGSLWNSIRIQISAILKFRDFPILHGYFQNLAGCPFYFLLCFFSFWGCFKIFFRLCGDSGQKT